MNNPRTDAGARLGWALRRYWVPWILIASAFAGLGLVAAGNADESPPRYEAEALIGAADLQIRPEQLPRTASIMFRSGVVARATVEALSLDVDPQTMVPDVIELVPIEDTVLLQIGARDPDAETAAVLANTAAEAMLTVLNDLGDGFGVFKSVASATAPPSPVPAASGRSSAAVAVLAGLVFASGFVALLLVVRAPVLTPTEAQDLVAAPHIGTLVLPRGPLEPPEAPGLSAMIRKVLPDRQGTAVFVAIDAHWQARSRVALLFAKGLARSGPVSFVASPDGPRPESEVRNLAITDAAKSIAQLDDVPVIIDGPSAAGLDVPQFLPSASRVVLVIPEGVRGQAVQEASQQFLDGELTGFVFVRSFRGSGS